MDTEVDTSKPENGEPKPISKTVKIITTLAVFYGNITYGCAMTAYSPALTDFKNKFDTDTSTISVVFTVIMITYMCGALLCSVIYNFVNRQLVVIFLFVGMSTVMFLSPHVPNLTLFYCLGGLLGFCMGSYDTAQVVWMMEMWQAESGPYVQAQHFFYAIGSVIAPVAMSPFLTEEPDEDDITTTTPAEKENARLFVPFTIFGSICAVTAVAQLFLFIFMRYRPPPREVETEENDKQKSDKKEQSKLANQDKNFVVRWFLNQWPGWPIARLVILSMLTIGFDQGMEIAYTQLFPTFGQNSDVALSESQAADTLTGYTIAFTVARGSAVILALWVAPQYMLFGNIALAAVGNILLVIWGNKSKNMIWAAAIFFGLGFSSLLPSYCTYMERYLEFTNTIGALMIVSGSFIGAMYPVIVGGFIDDHPLVITYPIFFSLAVLIIAVGIAYNITRKSKNRAGE